MPTAFRLPPTAVWSLKAGLTLVELMVATSILAIGLVLVARAFLTASAALDSVDNRIRAVQFLEAAMVELQQQANQEGGVLPGNRTGTTTLKFRPATWVLEIATVELQDTAQQGPNGTAENGTAPETETSESAASTIRLAEVRLALSWPEAHRHPDTALVTYLGQRAEPIGKPEE